MVPMSNREVTGSLFERNGRYTAVLNLYDKNGKRRQKSVALGIPVKGNKRKAQARLEELKKEYSSGITEPEVPQEESPLFADFLREWLKVTAPTIERTTYQLQGPHRRPSGYILPGAWTAPGRAGAQAHPGAAPVYLQGRLQRQHRHPLPRRGAQGATVRCEERVGERKCS